MGNHLLSVTGEWGKWEISKLTCVTDQGDWGTCVPELEADYVTDSMMDDGIWNACRYFGLI